MAENNHPRELTHLGQSCLYLICAQEAIKNVIAKQGYVTEQDLSEEIKRLVSDSMPTAFDNRFQTGGEVTNIN